MKEKKKKEKFSILFFVIQNWVLEKINDVMSDVDMIYLCRNSRKFHSIFIYLLMTAIAGLLSIQKKIQRHSHQPAIMGKFCHR